MLSGLLDEAYEVLAAINNLDRENLQEELGDLLFGILMICQVAEDEAGIPFKEVAGGITEKMIRRHPHVFGGEVGEEVATIRKRWEEIKQEEGRPLEVPRHLPALLAARKVQERWEDSGRGRVNCNGLKGLLGPGDPEEEVGRLLFRVVALARELGVEPELALRRTTEEFLQED